MHIAKQRLLCLSICVLFFLSGCVGSYDKGYADGYRAAKQAETEPDVTNSDQLPLVVVDNEIYTISLIDAYQQKESFFDDQSEFEHSEQCYIFKFEFVNKHKSSNIRFTLKNASINGYSPAGLSDLHSDDSFSVYTWCDDSVQNHAIGRFRLFYSDIESATDIRNAGKMDEASLSFALSVYIIDEMDDYGEETVLTIENAFQYCA